MTARKASFFIKWGAQMELVKSLEIDYGTGVLTRRERLARMRGESDIFVSYVRDKAENLEPELTAVTIELHGKLAAVPSLKNSKPMGRNFMSARARDYIETLNSMYWDTRRDEALTFGAAPIFAFIVFGKRPQRFDPDNGATTIKDWLEPSTKIVGGKVKRDRGWGSGLVLDDNQVTAFAVRAADLKIETPITTIYLRKLSRVRENIVELFARIIMEG